MLNLMYITNNVDVALIAQENGVDRIFVDMEYIGKDKRQGKMDTVQNFHTVEDVEKIRNAIKISKLLVRVNPIHSATSEYCSSEDEINSVIKAGADIIMLPYFKTVEEVEKFFKIVNKRVRTILLIETPEAVNVLDDILNLKDIDEVYIGLNDLSLGYGKSFMFELLADGTVYNIVAKFKEKNLSFGFGGIASLNNGDVSGHLVIKEHFRLGSSSAILSRSFCNVNKYTDNKDNLNEEDKKEIRKIFSKGLEEIYIFEKECEKLVENNVLSDFEENRKKLVDAVREVVINKNK